MVIGTPVRSGCGRGLGAGVQVEPLVAPAGTVVGRPPANDEPGFGLLADDVALVAVAQKYLLDTGAPFSSIGVPDGPTTGPLRCDLTHNRNVAAAGSSGPAATKMLRIVAFRAPISIPGRLARTIGRS